MAEKYTPPAPDEKSKSMRNGMIGSVIVMIIIILLFLAYKKFYADAKE